MNLERDLEKAYNVIYGNCSHHFDRIYARTNENLTDTLGKFDFNDKNVFSVLASSDQLLKAYCLGARNVDTFDINQLAEYYYYLRKWEYIYDDCLYPFGKSNDQLLELLHNVIPKYEEELIALKFWKILACSARDFNLLSSCRLFNYHSVDYRFDFDELSKIRETFEKQKLSFQKCDIFKPLPASVKSKYDIVIMSNILEYCNGHSGLVVCRDNLSELLKPGGKAICTRFSFERFDSFEKSVIKRDFRIREGNRNIGDIIHQHDSPYFVLEKKKN